jgi:hypothetical protein
MLEFLILLLSLLHSVVCGGEALVTETSYFAINSAP